MRFIKKTLKFRRKAKKAGAVGICPRCGRLVFPTPEAVVSALGAWDYEESYIPDQYTVVWDEEGWRGGIGGGIRRSCDGRGWENF